MPINKKNAKYEQQDQYAPANITKGNEQFQKDVVRIAPLKEITNVITVPVYASAQGSPRFDQLACHLIYFNAPISIRERP